MKKTIIIMSLLSIATFSYADDNRLEKEEKVAKNTTMVVKERKSIAGLIWRLAAATLVVCILADKTGR